MALKPTANKAPEAPEAPAPEAPTPEVPEAPAPEAPEAPAPEAPAPEAPAPEATAKSNTRQMIEVTNISSMTQRQPSTGIQVDSKQSEFLLDDYWLHNQLRAKLFKRV